jgi:DNA-binding transcriptional LysR family regulator
MDRLKTMEAFAEVARRQGFAPAARELGLSTSAVSRYVAELESWLGVQLLRRTTRRVSLTAAGRTYLERCQRILDEVADLTRAADELHREPRGEIRMTAPVFVGKHLLGPVLPGFLARYPNVKVRLHLIDRFVDLVDEGFDLALRIADLPDSTLVARKLGDTKLMLTAAPGYLEEHGIPETAEDLKAHNCLVDLVAGHGDRWPFAGAKGPLRLRVGGNLTVNSGEMVREATLAGLGVSLLPDFFVARDVAKGRLVALLGERVIATAGIFAVYPPTRHLSSGVRALIDALAARMMTDIGS